MKDYGFAANAVDEEEIGSKVTLGKACPIDAAFIEPMFSESIR